MIFALPKAIVTQRGLISIQEGANFGWGAGPLIE
jgi:hypothetical protein